MVPHDYNPSTPQAKTGGLRGPDIHRKTLSQRTKANKERNKN
jgi:hypothetical protein